MIGFWVSGSPKPTTFPLGGVNHLLILTILTLTPVTRHYAGLNDTAALHKLTIMKKLLLLFALANFLLPAQLFAQYSNASLNGTWVIMGQNDIYINFDGNGHITDMGFQQDSVFPVGTYSVAVQGAFTSTLNLTQGITTVTGNMLTDTSAVIVVDTTQGPFLVFKVSNTGALAGVWSGYIYDSTTQALRNIQLTVNSSGTITASTGVSLIGGNIYAVRDTFAGYLTTNDTECVYKYIGIYGIASGDSLTGIAQLGLNLNNNGNQSNPCFNKGAVHLTKITTGIASVKNNVDFLVYPNPFSDLIEIAINNPTGKIEADIFDVLGKKVYSAVYGNAQNITINNLPMLSRGVYFLSLALDGKVMTRRIIKD